MSERGQALVEATLILPVCLVCALAIVDCGVLVRDRLAVVQSATRAAEAQLAGRDPERAARSALPASLRGVQVRTAGGELVVRATSRTWLTRAAATSVDHESRVQMEEVR